jgi:hypothetical protein
LAGHSSLSLRHVSDYPFQQHVYALRLTQIEMTP